jgi:hypothetical protein
VADVSGKLRRDIRAMRREKHTGAPELPAAPHCFLKKRSLPSRRTAASEYDRLTSAVTVRRPGAWWRLRVEQKAGGSGIGWPVRLRGENQEGQRQMVRAGRTSEAG